MLPVHRITLDGLQPSPEVVCAHVARHLPEAVFGPTAAESRVEMLLPAESVTGALLLTWDAITTHAEQELYAVVGAPSR